MEIHPPSLDGLYVATPCPADWEAMAGNDKVRFCKHCDQNVYNISMMTRVQAETLITNTEGHLCTRFYRRADGTILTKDCPLGLAAVKRRVSRMVNATFGILLSLLTGAGLRSSVYAYEPQDKDAKIKRTKVPAPAARASISGTLFDTTKAVIADAKITLLNEKTNETKTINTSEAGTFQLGSLRRRVVHAGRCISRLPFVQKEAPGNTVGRES